jgi:hypothetical protein
MDYDPDGGAINVRFLEVHRPPCLPRDIELTQPCVGQQPARQLHRPELQSRNRQLTPPGDAR